MWHKSEEEGQKDVKGGREEEKETRKIRKTEDERKRKKTEDSHKHNFDAGTLSKQVNPFSR
jgi:hypothetical protein